MLIAFSPNALPHGVSSKGLSVLIPRGTVMLPAHEQYDQIALIYHPHDFLINASDIILFPSQEVVETDLVAFSDQHEVLK
jgi:hypothetical protein